MMSPRVSLLLCAVLAFGASPRGFTQAAAPSPRSDNGQSMTIGEFFLESFNPTIEAGLYFYNSIRRPDSRVGTGRRTHANL